MGTPHLVHCVVEYDENSVAWLVCVERPDLRVPLEHGAILWAEWPE